VTAAVKQIFWPLLLAVVALTLFEIRVRHQMPDFAVYRQAGVRAAHAEPLYRPNDGHYQFKYLPAFALAMVPFGGLKPASAKALWYALSVGWLAIFLRWSVRALPERRWSERSLLWFTILLMAKFYGHELTLGQTNLLLGALLVAALLAIQIDHPLVAAGLVGVAAFVKPYALVLLPWIAVTQGLAPALLSVGVVVTGLAAPAVVYGWSGNLDLLAQWYRTVTDSTAPNLLVSDNISLAAMWAKWIGPGREAAALAAMSGLAALGLGAAIWRKRGQVGAPDYLEFAFLMLLIPLLSPQGWDYVLVLATPAVVCLVDRWRDTHGAWRWLTAAALATMGLTIFDIMGRSLYGRFMALSIVSVCAIVAATGLAHLRWRSLA
jgi:hypothetical protein